MPVTVHCPDCDAVLSSPKPIPAGTKVRCSTCKKVFQVPNADADEPRTATAVRSRKAAPVVPARVDRDDEPDDEPEAEEEERPRKKKKKRKSDRKSGSKVGLLVGVGLAVLLLLGGGGFGLYALLGSSNRGSNDPLGYIPPDVNSVTRYDYAALVKEPGVWGLVEPTLVKHQGTPFVQEVLKNTGLTVPELFAETYTAPRDDASMLRRGPADPEPTTLILRPSKAFKPSQVAAASKSATRKKIRGRVCYEMNESTYRTLYMPCDQIIVLSALSAEQLENVVASDGSRPALAPAILDAVRSVDKSPLWSVSIQRGNNGPTAPVPPQMAPLAKAFEGTRAIAFALHPEGNQVKLRLGVRLPDDAQAAQAAKAVNDNWKEMQTGLTGVETMMFLSAPKTVKLLQEIKKSAKFTAEGSMAFGTATTAKKTFDEAAPELARNGPQMGGMPFGPR